LGRLIWISTKNSQIRFLLQIIDRRAIVGKTVRLQCAIHISLRRPFRFLQGRVLLTLVQAALCLMVDDHLIPLRGRLFSLTLVQILPRGDQDVAARFNLGPFQTLLLSVGIGTQLDAAGIVVEEAITAILKRPAPATSTVFLLQKGGSLFGAVMFSIVGRNTFFSVRKPAAGCQRCS